ncbi:MAG: ATP F0F1 synthase subunit gamma [Bacteroides sp. SM23_62_1]|nr:MAG: ATP F0F1 synthase subunit gamma [Bacteroides sp. SM23_62_1]
MASLKEIRTRIASVSSTRQITNAMKMVSASKLRKAQDAILQMRPYANKLQEILGSVSDALSKDEGNIYLREQEPEHILVVVITSNRGLCGAFNANVMRKVTHLVFENYGDLMKKGNLHFFAIGKRGADYLKRKKYPVIGVRNDLFDGLNFKSAGMVGEDLIHKFLVREYDKIFLIYNQFKNAAVQILTTEQFLPLVIPETEEDSRTFHDYIFEPTKEYIVKELIPKSLKIQFYKSLLDSNASENGARMTAMHQATDNATELLRELRLHYNKARQASITKELLEIVSGAEALKG